MSSLKNGLQEEVLRCQCIVRKQNETVGSECGSPFVDNFHPDVINLRANQSHRKAFQLMYFVLPILIIDISRKFHIGAYFESFGNFYS